MAKFDKTQDTGLKFLTLEFANVGTRTLTEVFEMTPTRPGDKNTMKDADMYGNVAVVKSRDDRISFNVTVRQGSDDEVFLLNAVNERDLGKITYIDKSGENEIKGSGYGVSVNKHADRTGNKEEETLQYTVQATNFKFKA